MTNEYIFVYAKSEFHFHLNFVDLTHTALQAAEVDLIIIRPRFNASLNKQLTTQGTENKDASDETSFRKVNYCMQVGLDCTQTKVCYHQQVWWDKLTLYEYSRKPEHVDHPANNISALLLK